MVRNVSAAGSVGAVHMTSCSAQRTAQPHEPAALPFAMTPDASAISVFWTWFRANDAKLTAMLNADLPYWDTALSQLKAVHQGLWFEVSDEIRGRREFVITAEGDPKLFPLVDAMVAEAPEIVAWVFVALKPAMGFDFVTTYEGMAFDSKSMWFLPLESSGDLSNLGLRIGIPGLNDEMRRVAGNAVMVILDTGLGERSSAMDVQHVEFAEIPSQPEKVGYIELPDLPAYIAWRKRKQALA
jgi:hypothetical protein